MTMPQTASNELLFNQLAFNQLAFNQLAFNQLVFNHYADTVALAATTVVPARL
ncbi:hypothetical protein GCM10008111_10360 [Alishewanella tabrizica]|uniref:Uncharacterized protein n=1 Tax=Alishewanella tabrizica TaxID=671278 RepID=A0ABQ2WI52_9ALTE|nr:hypothetical protein GCM10008111_10360 [Alishewanella tabrizica]